MKRILSIFIVVTMFTTFIPCVSAQTIREGVCGDNLSYIYGENGTLTIIGTGDMYEYDRAGTNWTPWYSYEEDIKNIVIKDGVTSISEYAFYGCEELQSVSIPNTIKEISEMAFNDCKNLKEVIIPEGIEKIGWCSFMNCTSLNSVELPNSLKVIDGHAFRYCENIEEIIIPTNVTEIGYLAFEKCIKLKEVQIPDSVNILGESAFAYCTGLESVVIPTSITEMPHVFEGCDIANVYYRGKKEQWSKIKNIYSSYGDGSNYPFRNSEIYYESKKDLNKLQKDKFPKEMTLDYYAVAGLEWIELYDLNAKVEIADENVARLEDGIVIADIGSDTADYISKQIVPVSPGKTTITAYMSDGTTKRCNLTITGIKINLNGEPITFDQPPINQEGNLLVPIRMIAENMGKEVLWSDKVQTAFIDNTNNALLIPIGETTLYKADEQAYNTWETVKTNVPSQVINGRTLVPIRQFSEALGAKVDWNDKYSTASITYDNIESEAMHDSLFDAINLNYYIGTNGDNPFAWYTDNVVNPFYDSRNPTIDKITMGIGKPWTAVTELFAEIYGDTNASINLQKSLYEVLNEVPEDASYDLDLSLLKDLKEYADSGLTLFDEVGGLTKDFLDNHKSLEPLNDSLMKFAQSDTTGKVSEIFDWTVFTAEELAYWLSDYSANISYLDALENALYNQGMLNSHMQHAIADLRIEYSNKFLQTLFDIWDQVVDKGFSAAMKMATGNAYGLGKVAWGTIFNATGVTKKGEALKSFYSLYCYNGALDREFSDIILSSKDNVNIPYVNALINLQKATKTVAINSIANMANWWAKDEVNQSADELKTSLNSWSYYTWENTNAVNNGGNNGGGGGSW